MPVQEHARGVFRSSRSSKTY